MNNHIWRLSAVCLSLIAALVFSAPAHAAEDEIYMYTVCYKARPGKIAELRTFLTETAPKLAKASLGTNNQVAWGANETIIPIGEAAECDFATYRIYRGAPSSVGIGTPGAAAKAGLDQGKVRSEFQAAARVKASALWRGVDGYGESKVGDYVKIDLMDANDMADWTAIESRIFKPVQQERAKAGKIKAWGAYQMVSPAGSDREYNAITVNTLPDLKALSAPAGYQEAFKKAHPGVKIEWVFEKTASVRTIVRSNIVQVIARVGEM